MLHYDLNREDGYLLICLIGDLDIEATELMHQEIIPLIVAHAVVQLDFSQVPFVDSSGMGLLIELVRATEVGHTKVTITHVREEVFEVFELLQLPEILGEEVFV